MEEVVPEADSSTNPDPTHEDKPDTEDSEGAEEPAATVATADVAAAATAAATAVAAVTATVAAAVTAAAEPCPSSTTAESAEPDVSVTTKTSNEGKTKLECLALWLHSIKFLGQFIVLFIYLPFSLSFKKVLCHPLLFKSSHQKMQAPSNFLTLYDMGVSSLVLGALRRKYY